MRARMRHVWSLCFIAYERYSIIALFFEGEQVIYFLYFEINKHHLDVYIVSVKLPQYMRLFKYVSKSGQSTWGK